MFPSREPSQIECEVCLCISIRLEPLREPGQKDTVYDNIVPRYVLIIKLRRIIVDNLEPQK
jgi:hypothetical protein